MICSGLCACTEMGWMCVMYVSFGSKIRPRTFGCVVMASALFCIFDRVQVVLSGFSMRLFCFVQAKLSVGMVVYISWLHLCLGVDVMVGVICVDHDLNRCTGWWLV